MKWAKAADTIDLRQRKSKDYLTNLNAAFFKLKNAQLKETLRKSKQETHKLQASGSSEGADFESKVPDEPTDESDDVHDEENNNNDDDSGNDDDGGNDVQDSERTDSDDDDENNSFTLKDYEEEEQDEEYVHTPEKDKSDDEENIDTDMTNAEQGRADQQNASHESGFVYKEEDTHLKEEVNVAVRLQSNKLKEEAEADNQEFSDQVDSTIKQIIKEQVKAQVSKIMPQIEKYVTDSLGAEVLARSTNQPQRSYVIAASLSEFELKKIIIDKIETNESINRSDIQRNLYNVLVESYNIDNDIISTYGDVVTLKRGRDDQDKDEYPSAGSGQRMKRRKSSKHAKPSKGSKSKESKSSSSSKGTQSQPKSSASTHNWFQKLDKPPTPDRPWNKSKFIDFRPPQKWISTIAKARQPPRMFDELMGTTINFSAYVMNRLKIDNLTQEILVGRGFNMFKGACKSFAELDYHLEECYKAVNDKIDWNNQEGHTYPFDISKPLLLIKDRGHPADYFINNDLKYLKGGSSSSKYATSITRTKAVKYENIEGIEDMVLTLWNPVKVAYNKHVVWGTVTNVKVMRWYDYGYLEEILVRIEDNVLYKFKECDFLRLNLRDIKDMLLLLVRKKLSNLDVDDRYDLGVALRMFTRRIIILHHIEDLHLRVESYQKKLNISKLTPYTTYKILKGIIYQHKYKRNKLMRSDKLYKFFDRTLSSVKSVLNDISSNLEMDYLPERHWSNLEMKRPHIMFKAIDKLLFEKRLMRNFEEFVGGRDYENDLRLLERTI
uniref:Uncharacterized protein n=1 Tax=Tanacetum cinerariifolium TaxID=118510 RepID=A0A6L2LAC6_TANCI|nr:hypothetical protein [Tanacetum cinerariifolium]